MEIWSPNCNIAWTDPRTHPARGPWRGSVQGADHEMAQNVKLPIIHISSDSLWLSSKFLKDSRKPDYLGLRL